MKITRVETFLVPPRWLFCRVETDEGLLGWGEPVIEGRAQSVRAAVHELAEVLIGADPLRIEDHWQVMTKGGFYRGGPVLASAVAGLDQALWDIAGKARGVPVHELLGGPVREYVRAYAWIGGDEPEQLREEAQRQVEAGFSAVKMNASGRMSPIAGPGELDAVVARVAAAREALGPGRDVAVDFHGRVSYPNARRLLTLLEPLAPMFVEEPVVPESMAQVRSLVEASNIPIALGERLYSRWDFLPAMQAGVAVAQPDLSHAGGISEVRRIAAQAEVFGALLAPHCPLGPISLAASLQVAFATPNFLIQEQSIGIHYNDGNELLDYLVDPAVFSFTDGRLARPVGAGLGIVVDEARVREADRRGHNWRSPIWRYPDDSFAEW
ncbi:galactonate dehydratase [Acrocarpospora pleiomorpha]|uniref:Galactonate dehydratase n=1 Tax=Acrocarpospora pleiomorpha TaxID=90975 RepID=A0A5M3XGZ9_9ACTN|nr:galactonate dehydratase [Acrocarpospora pleiomorpha]GES20815.1 galactonate dehydratase [Acrocarpospora pleiomorpha]